MRYLVYQDKTGTPVAVFTPDESHFDAGFEGNREGLIDYAQKTRGPLRSWEDWTQSLAEKTPTRHGQWNAVDRRDQALPVLLRALQRSTYTA